VDYASPEGARRLRATWPTCVLVGVVAWEAEALLAEGCPPELNEYILRSPKYCRRLPALLQSLLDTAELEQRIADRTAELRAANEHLQALSRLKDEFVSNVSHELRTPITSLKLYHDLLASRPERRDDYLSRLKRETNRLERLVEDLLRLSRIDQGQVKPQLAPLDLNALVTLYVTDRQAMAASLNLTLTIIEHPHLPQVRGDQAMLGQVLSIMLTNALNYTPAGGKIVIRIQVDADQRQAGFSVADTGAGIPADELPSMFQRFFRGTAGRRSSTPGTGLGLAIVREIIERHHGRVAVQSTGVPGEGATFSVWLPFAVSEGGV